MQRHRCRIRPYDFEDVKRKRSMWVILAIGIFYQEP